MIFVGIDLSLNRTAITILNSDGSPIVNKVLDIGKLKLRGQERLSFIYDFFNKLFEKHSHLKIVGIEGYSFGSRGRATFSIGEAGGIVRLILHRNRIRYYIFAPNTIKKFATKKGTAKKSLMIKAVFKRWNFDTDDEDIADSFSIAKLTFAYYSYINGTRLKLTTFDKEVLNKIKNDRGE